MPSNKDMTMKSSLKRDKSIIFSTVPEEDVDHSSCLKLENIEVSMPILENKPGQKFSQKFSRPTHLPLKYKNVTSRDFPDSGLGIDKTDEDEMIPEFKGQTSVCSTPMTDLNKILHGRALSICGEIDINKQLENNKSKLQEKLNNIENDPQKLKLLQEGFLNLNKFKRRNSLPDLRKNRTQKGFPMRTYGFGLCRFTFNADADDNDSYLKRNRTLSEPCYNKVSDFMIENSSVQLDFQESRQNTKNSLNKEMLNKPSPKELDTSTKISKVLDKSKMTLPLKSHTPVGPGPIPLTPLMSKLSILSTMQDSIYDLTPTEIQENISMCNTPITSIVNSDLNNSDGYCGRHRTHLLICGQRDMTLFLILEDEAGLNEQLVTEMVRILNYICLF